MDDCRELLEEREKVRLVSNHYRTCLADDMRFSASPNPFG